MTLVNAPGLGMFWPDPLFWSTNNATILLDASGEKYAATFRVSAAATLGYVRFRTGTVTTGDTLKVSFQNVSAANGDPDGTPDQYRAIVVAGSDDNVWLLTGLLTDDGTDTGAKRTVAKGDLLSVVIEFNSYVAGNLNLLSATMPLDSGNEIYVDHQTGGAWAKQSTACGCLEILDDASVPVPVRGLNVAIQATDSPTNATTPDEVALYFKFPWEVKADGACMWIDVDAVCDVVLYDSDGTTALETISLDPDIRQPSILVATHIEFSQARTFAAETWYRLALKPTSASAVGTRSISVPNAASMGALPGGSYAYWSQRTDGGAWTETTTKRPKFFLRLSALHTGGGQFIGS